MARLSFRPGETFGFSVVCNNTVARLATQAARSALPCVVLVLLSFSGSAVAQADIGHLELHSGYTHITSDGGLDGINAGAALRFNKRVSVGFDFDSAWDRSLPTAFVLSGQGAVTIRSYLANYLLGPRVFFPSKKLTFKNQQLIPFAEFQFGGSHLSTTIEQVGLGSRHNSETQYSWLLGGGADYGFTRHWSGRINADLFRTHFASTGQSRFRLVLGVVYTFAGGGK
jgi:opacity protein-like surface antigen